MTLDKQLGFPGPGFPRTHAARSCITDRFVGRKHIKPLTRCLAHSKNATDGSYSYYYREVSEVGFPLGQRDVTDVCREADASAQGTGRARESLPLPALSPVAALGLYHVTVKFCPETFQGVEPNVASGQQIVREKERRKDIRRVQALPQAVHFFHR